MLRKNNQLEIINRKRQYENRPGFINQLFDL